MWDVPVNTPGMIDGQIGLDRNKCGYYYIRSARFNGHSNCRSSLVFFHVGRSPVKIRISTMTPMLPIDG